MKTTKKIISLILCVLMLVSAMSVTAFAEEKTPSYLGKYHHYTYFGDSISAGVAVGTYWDDTYARMGYMRIQNCYADLVADAIGYPDDAYNSFMTEEGYMIAYSKDYYDWGLAPGIVSPSANVGVRVCDLRYLVEACMVKEGLLAEEDAFVPIGDTYYETNGSNYAPGQYFDYNTWTMKDRTDSVLFDLKDSDLITVELGSNDMFTCPVTLMLNDENFINILSGQGIHIDFAAPDGGMDSVMQNIDAIYEVILSSADTVKTLIGYMSEGLKDIYKNYPVLVEDMLKLNGDADILLMGLYNPFSGMGIQSDSNTSLLCDSVSIFTALVNDYIAEIANSHDNVYYVDVMDTESLIMANQDSVLGDGMWTVFTNIHPSLEGHQYMAKQVLNKLEAINKCDHENTVRIHEKKATILKAGYTGDLICSDCGQILETGKVVSYKFGEIVIPTHTVISVVKVAVNTITNALNNMLSGIFGK